MYKKRSREEFTSQRVALIKLGVKVRGANVIREDRSSTITSTLADSDHGIDERLGPWKLLEKLGGGSYGKVVRAYNADGEILD